MSISLAVAIYFLVWWITLFAVLPWGVRAQGEGRAPGTDPGAPQLPRLLSKLLWTTVVATAIFGVGAFLYVNKYVTLDDLARLIGMPA
jgi:predicted secreted protein